MKFGARDTVQAVDDGLTALARAHSYSRDHCGWLSALLQQRERDFPKYSLALFVGLPGFPFGGGCQSVRSRSGATWWLRHRRPFLTAAATAAAMALIHLAFGSRPLQRDEISSSLVTLSARKMGFQITSEEASTTLLSPTWNVEVSQQGRRHKVVSPDFAKGPRVSLIRACYNSTSSDVSNVLHAFV